MPHAYLYKRDLTGSKNLKGVWCLLLLLIILELMISFKIANNQKLIKFMLKSGFKHSL
jgi:hypothetical protein